MQDITITLNGVGIEEVTLDKIKEAIKKDYPQLLREENWPEGFDLDQTDGADFILYESDLSTLASGSYESGTVLALGFKPKTIGYTSSITTAGGGKREFLTDVNWGESEQPLSKILEKAGIDAGGDNKYTPIGDNAPPSTDWEFQGWAEAGDPTTILTPTDGTTYISGTNFVAVYKVPYKINIGGTEYEVKVPVTAPNEGATWEQIKQAAKDTGSLIPSGDQAKLDDDLTWGAKKPGDTEAAEFEGGVQFPANTSFEALVEYSYKITDANGKEVEVDFGFLPSTTEIKLSDIIEKAIEDANESGETVDFGSTHDGSGNVSITNWTDGTNNIADGATGAIAPGAEIKPISKELTYSVNKGEAKDSSASDVKITLTGADATNAGSSLKDILQKAFGNTDPIADADKANAPGGKDIASGWKVTLPDDTEKIVSSKQINDGTGGAAGIFPPGTKIEPNWVTNADASLGGSDRNLTLDELRKPQIGDGVTDEGKIIARDKVGAAIADGKTILGYIYNVDETNHQVKVVAKEVQPQKTWSYSAGSAVYKGVLGSVKLSDKIGSVESGFDGWIKITEYNSHAVYGNYQAVMYAICYPRKPSDDPIKYDESILGGLTSSNNPDKFSEAWEYNYKIDNVVNGDGYDNKWYLPSVAELMQIYGAKDALLNWTEAKHRENSIGTTGIADSQEFWSVNVSATSTGGGEYHNAKYVDFGAEGGPKAIDQDKYQVGSTKSLHYVLPVAEFRYEDYQVNH